jgi:hypothetical protein
VTLRVVGAGLGRTGTNSLKVALEQLLGEPCYHMSEVGNHPEHAGLWAAAYAGEATNWDELFTGYAAAVDWPAAGLWQKTAEAYPDALILLSVRSADSWWTSCSSTIFNHLEAQLAENDMTNPWTAMLAGMMGAFTYDWRDEGAAKAAFEAHNAEVRRTAGDRLLEWQPSDGWEPICERLGLPVPNEPFPHTNTTADMRAHLGLDKEDA